ncbi:MULTISPECIES: acetate/propionate family kinase [Winogradskyella]|uniref:acetate/propionate family kinase n=1 Tax=Winogradskyella TaxID=286104 RepID=UPI0015CD3981|nr:MULTISPECIES: acetate kinase [Winogradskyella]QXP77716.1 acetate kinase [Winogradskyella sp. HaHa_3_26]
MQQILVLNSGSSSLKFQLFTMPEETVLCSGLIERIGSEDAKFKYKTNREKIRVVTPIPNHKVALEILAKQLLDPETGSIKSPEDIDVVAHRVVHGGKEFSETIEITKNVKDKIKALSPLAPLHNPANLEGINIAETIFKKAKQVAVFDTAFHQTIPEHVYKYALPNKFSDKIRLYGFHGTSHKYVSEKAIGLLGEKESKIITIHLGNGCSMSAIKNGVCIDHSLGFSPNAGLIMGTRSGDLDPTIIFYLAEKFNLNLKELNTLLQKESGMLGLTGHGDLREIEELAKEGDKACQLAIKMNTYRIKKYIGSYTAALNGLDAIVFTAGIGENSTIMRELICEDLDFLGIKLDIVKNNERLKTIRTISTSDSKIKVFVIPTNEELEIAKETYDLLVKE